jgi:hypothetical protein
MSREPVLSSSPINRKRSTPDLPTGPQRADPPPIRGDAKRTPVKDSDKPPPVRDGGAPSGRGR